MRTTSIGFVTALLFAVLPFLDISRLFYSETNTKLFLVVLAIDIVIAIAAYSFLRGKPSFSWKRRPLLWGIGLAAAALYLSLFFGVDSMHSLWSDIIRSTGVLFLTHVALFAILLGQFLTPQDWSNVHRTVAISTATLAFLTLFGSQGFGYTGLIVGLDFTHTGLSLGNDTFAGAYLVIAIALTLVEIARTTSIAWRRALITCAAFMSISPVLFNVGLLFGRTPFTLDPTIILGTARASSLTLIGLYVFIAGWLLLKRFAGNVRFANVAWSGLFAAGVITVSLLLIAPGSFVQQTYLGQASEARLTTWERSWEALAERPVFGWGPENFSYAFQAHFDRSLYKDTGMVEVWFDKAHNATIDTLVTLGGFGTLVFVLLVGAYLYVLRRAYKEGKLGEFEAVLLGAIPFAHFLQIQTSFDTVITYGLFAVVFGYVLSLERAHEKTLPIPAARVIGVLLVLFVLFSVKTLLVDEYGRQVALSKIFEERTSGAQVAAATKALERESDFESLRLSSGSFIKGTLAHIAQGGSVGPGIEQQARVYESAYEHFIQSHPAHYRARVNYAYFLLAESAWGEQKAVKARALLKESYVYSPENPITSVLEAVAYLYTGDTENARTTIARVVLENPESSFVAESAAYIETQAAGFPKIDVLKLENL